MSLNMLQPIKKDHTKNYWFRRRVPAKYRKFGMPSEIKFSLGTADWDEAVLRCQEENLKLERTWRANLEGEPPSDLSHATPAELALFDTILVFGPPPFPAAFAGWRTIGSAGAWTLIGRPTGPGAGR